jgi:hypothetical protein
MKTTTNTDRKGMAAALWGVAVVGVLLTLAAPVLLGAGAAPSAAIGAALALGNLWALSRLVQSFLQGTGARLPWLVVSVLKFCALFLIVAVLVRAGHAAVLPLMLGFAALPLGIVASQLRTSSPAESEG